MLYQLDQGLCITATAHELNVVVITICRVCRKHLIDISESSEGGPFFLSKYNTNHIIHLITSGKSVAAMEDICNTTEIKYMSISHQTVRRSRITAAFMSAAKKKRLCLTPE